MSEFSNSFTITSPFKNCGFTVDAFKTPDAFDVIQFLWAVPLASLGDRETNEVAGEIHKAAKQSGFEPANVAPYKTHLPNEAALLEQCPFQPEMCVGQHLVISGSGRASPLTI